MGEIDSSVCDATNEIGRGKARGSQYTGVLVMTYIPIDPLWQSFESQYSRFVVPRCQKLQLASACVSEFFNCLLFPDMGYRVFFFKVVSRLEAECMYRRELPLIFILSVTKRN